MFTTNPFTPLTAFISPALMQGYILLMIAAVAVGTAYDLLHDHKARFFLQERQRSRALAVRKLRALDIAAVAVRTAFHDVATFGEFCNRQRRISHALMFYGFVLYVITTLVMVFAFPNAAHTPTALPLLWYLGILLTLSGGYWFFFLLRVNVVHDGHSPWRLVRADLFIVTLLASLTFALFYGLVAATGNGTAIQVFAGIYVGFTTLLCVSVPWSKFAHMFYKPAAAFQRRIEEADGSSDLPAPTAKRSERCPHSHT